MGYYGNKEGGRQGVCYFWCKEIGHKKTEETAAEPPFSVKILTPFL